MKCGKCGDDLRIGVAAKVFCDRCKVLTSITSIVTVQCGNCGHVFQVPVESKSFFSAKEE